MHESHGFNLLSHLPFFQDIPNHVGMTLIVSILLVGMTWVARSQLVQVMQSEEGGLIPEQKLTYRNFFEIIEKSIHSIIVF